MEETDPEYYFTSEHVILEEDVVPITFDGKPSPIIPRSPTLASAALMPRSCSAVGLLTKEEYGWFSDIEADRDVMLVEYQHIASKGIYRVRNVRIESPPTTIGISLTGEQLEQPEPLEHPEQPEQLENPEKQMKGLEPARIRNNLRGHPLECAAGYSSNTSRFASGVLPKFIQYTNDIENPSTESFDNEPDKSDDPQSRSNTRERMNWYKNCVRNIFYVITIVCVVCCCVI